MHDEVTTERTDAAPPDVTGAEDAVEVEATDGAASEPAGIDLEARAEADPRSRGELVAAIDAAEAQRDEYLDDLRRAHADFENYRKRVTRDGAVQREQGRADVVLALLDVLDDLDRVVAASSAPDGDAAERDGTAVASGIRTVAEKAQHALTAFGVERVDAEAVAFDPTVHDAVQQVEVEGVDTPTVHQVLRPGYRLADRVLRPAMVVVAQG